MIMGPIEKKFVELEQNPMMSNPKILDALNTMMAELARAESLHPDWPADPIHQVAIMMEEAGEAVQAANDMVHKGAGVGPALRNELVQTGAMVIRCLMHLED